MASFYDDFKQYKDKIFYKYLYQAYYLELMFGWTSALCAYMLSMELSLLVWVRAIVFPPIVFYLSLTCRKNCRFLLTASGEAGSWFFLSGLLSGKFNPVVMV